MQYVLDELILDWDSTSSDSPSRINSKHTSSTEALLTGPIMAKHLSSLEANVSTDADRAKKIATLKMNHGSFTSKRERNLTAVSFSSLMIDIDSASQDLAINEASNQSLLRSSSFPSLNEAKALAHRENGLNEIAYLERFVPAWRRKTAVAIDQAKKNKRGKHENDLHYHLLTDYFSR